MKEQKIRVTSKREFKAAITRNWAPLFAGFMLGSNGSLQETMKSAADMADKEMAKAGTKPSPKRPFIMRVNMEAAVEEFIQNMPKYDLSGKKRKEDADFRSEDVYALVDMFKKHDWQLHHFDHIRRAGSTGPERFALARRIHEAGITPEHVSQAIANSVGLIPLVEAVESGQIAQDAIQSLIPKKERRIKNKEKPLKPSVQEPSPEKKPLTINNPELMYIMRKNGVGKALRKKIQPELVEEYEHAGISSPRIPLAYAVHRIAEKRDQPPIPLKELKALLNSRLEHPDHIIFVNHLSRETGEKHDVVLYTLEKHALGKNLTQREAGIILKAGDLSDQHPEGTQRALKRYLSQ